MIAVALGTVDAFNIPASASVPKLLVDAHVLGRAMAARQILTQGAMLCGPPLGGAAIAIVGLSATFWAGAVSYLGMLVVLWRVRSKATLTVTAAQSATLSRQVGQGLLMVFTTPLLRAIVLLTGAFAMFIVPFSPPLVPLVSTERGWDAMTTGVAAGAYGVGMACVTVCVLWRGTAERAGLSASVGMLTAGMAIAATAAAPEPLVFWFSALVAGLGTGVFSTHVGPLFVAASPREAIGRVQAVVAFAQWLPLLLANPLIGFLAQRHTAAVALVLWGSGAAVAGVVALYTPRFRGAVITE
ncbi:MFS transporter [Nocardiopsis gilva]|uniref:MFS transporter n=1 Tax=Nocardiopsis gilva TaxID=280236 RepID=UPI00034D7CB5|nr:MFS transporter [Nocardiopsis gilva]